MARSLSSDNEANQPIHIEKNCNSVSTVAREEVLHMSGSAQPAIEEDGRWFRAVVCLIALVIGVIVIYEVYRFHRHDELSAQAINLGKTFIHSSPVVEENLGTVKAVKEISEKQRTSPVPGWYVAFDVSGKRGSGVVEMRMRKTNDQWHVPSAQLQMGHSEVISLR
jgi:cytochrome oxidase complex assembly protein 1